MKLPYGLTQDRLVIEPDAVRNSTEIRNALKGDSTEKDLRLIGYAAMLLILHTDGTLAECIDTAIIWNFG